MLENRCMILWCRGVMKRLGSVILSFGCVILQQSFNISQYCCVVLWRCFLIIQRLSAMLQRPSMIFWLRSMVSLQQVIACLVPSFPLLYDLAKANIAKPISPQANFINSTLLFPFIFIKLVLNWWIFIFVIVLMMYP